LSGPKSHFSHKLRSLHANLRKFSPSSRIGLCNDLGHHGSPPHRPHLDATMLASSSDPRSATSTSSHPRRPPAHLSVSLRHENPAASDTRAAGRRGQQVMKGREGAARKTLIRQSSDDSNNSEESRVPNLQKWFDHSNTRPETGFPQNLEDSK
jgi:hypothetical protein